MVQVGFHPAVYVRLCKHNECCTHAHPFYAVMVGQRIECELLYYVRLVRVLIGLISTQDQGVVDLHFPCIGTLMMISFVLSWESNIYAYSGTSHKTEPPFSVETKL